MQANKAFEKFEKQIKAAKTSGKDAKQKQEQVGSLNWGSGHGRATLCYSPFVLFTIYCMSIVLFIIYCMSIPGHCFVHLLGAKEEFKGGNHALAMPLHTSVHLDVMHIIELERELNEASL